MEKAICLGYVTLRRRRSFPSNKGEQNLLRKEGFLNNETDFISNFLYAQKECYASGSEAIKHAV